MSEEKENLWAKLFTQERPSMEIDFPSNDGQPTAKLRIVELTAEEATVCEIDAETKLKKIFKGDIDKDTESYKSLYNKHNAANLLYRTCRNVDDSKIKIFPSPDSVLQYLSVDQMSILMNNYYDLIATKGSIKAISDPDEMELTITRLIQDGTSARFLLNSCSLEMLKDLVMYLVSQSVNLPMDNSSVTSQPEDTIKMTNQS